ncbi:hypothetical protein SeMB42_g04784 [Synchytrium endobioticum]|uniref:Uncharacterized protein n=1 Tax=Synchytrium endobioticum TaxID=286115 RepID=A0A507CVS7_9FUNG|nr:hypothetical protein SeMB42_g04784 [Synchytrium endobioticum]
MEKTQFHASQDFTLVAIHPNPVLTSRKPSTLAMQQDPGLEVVHGLPPGPPPQTPPLRLIPWEVPVQHPPLPFLVPTPGVAGELTYRLEGPEGIGRPMRLEEKHTATMKKDTHPLFPLMNLQR